ncbi:testis-expressed protein 54-like [Choloepus didactylus]|uniref:testis-expressed protein 54-like n=1 Tax=Choloepus didactylus TaxID=27675 RepID=UPI00189E2F48|nr:testis-expressed protein 54-like [Choloepus didactylus]
MGCCQDKHFQTCDDQNRDSGSMEGIEGTDAGSPHQRKPKSNESLLITVLWRRLSLFSRRGSSRSNKRQSVLSQKHEITILEDKQEAIQEKPEKG